MYFILACTWCFCFVCFFCCFFFFFKQKTAYEMRISDWSSDVCSSDLRQGGCRPTAGGRAFHRPGADGECRAGRVIDLPLPGRTAVEPPPHRSGIPRPQSRRIHRQYSSGCQLDRKSVVKRTSVAVRVDICGLRILKNKKSKLYNYGTT